MTIYDLRFTIYDLRFHSLQPAPAGGRAASLARCRKMCSIRPFFSKTGQNTSDFVIYFAFAMCYKKMILFNLQLS